MPYGLVLPSQTLSMVVLVEPGVQVDALTAVGSHACLPVLCSNGKLPAETAHEVTHYMVIKPVGEPLKLSGGKSVSASAAAARKAKFLAWMECVLSAVEHMHSQGWLHRCKLGVG